MLAGKTLAGMGITYCAVGENTKKEITMAIAHMQNMREFCVGKSPTEITALIAGKTIKSIEVDTGGMDNMLILNFTDESRIFIRYDWLYEWKFVDRITPALSYESPL